jgi:hypothetical protein
MSPTGMVAVITIMLALIVKGALEAAFKPLFDGSQTWSEMVGLPLAQLLVFFLLILRFYLGALRFGATEPKRVDFLVRSFNFVFAFAVFCAFYVIALSVTKPEFFYVGIIVLHAVDAAWFGILFGLSHLKFVDVPELEDNELLIGPVRRIMVTYFFFSIITIAVGIFIFPLDPSATRAHWLFLLFLVAITGIDFWAVFEYYFEFEKWCATRCKKSIQARPT